MDQREDLHRSFTDADAAPDVSPMAAFLREVDATPAVVAYRADLRAALALGPGEAVLDVGCGLGGHAARIAAVHDGPVTGLDREAMIEQARAASGGAVAWVPGDATALPLPDGSVDAAYTERVLMYLPDPGAAIAEMVRVLRPGGRIAAFELDYAGAVLPGEPEVADAVHAVLRDGVASDRMGRSLPALLAAAGVTGLHTRAYAVHTPRPVHDMIVREPVRRAIADGRLPAGAAEWLAEQERPGALTSVFPGVLVTGRVA